MKSEVYDAVIIGSGAGGGPCAYGLAAKGRNVLLLEAGPRYNPFTDYQLHKKDWEVMGFPERAKVRYAFGKSQPLKEELNRLRTWNRADGLFNASQNRKFYRYFHTRGVGGSTLQYQGEAHRFHPRAFAIKTLYGVGNNWPIRYRDLEPYYETAEKILGVAGPVNDPFHLRKKPLPLPPHKLSYASRIIKKGCSRLGLRLIPNSVAILSRPYDNRPYCNYCNGCYYGCPRKDKGSIDVTFIPKAEATGNCRVIEEAQVFRLNVEKGRVSEVLYYDREGKENAARARVVVVSCGAVETPRLLLNSGIANSSGHVGRNFTETLLWMSTAFHPKRVESYRGIPVDSEIQDYLFPKKKLPFASGLRLFTSPGMALGPMHFAMKYCRGWGRELKKEVERYFGHTLSVAGVGEFLPNKETFVAVAEKERDGFGVPAAMIQSFLGDNELRILDFMSGKCREILEASGASEIVENISSYDIFLASHVFGTCMMGNDPSASVVNRFCRSHDIPNLFIADASVFPSSGGGSSPALTISAVGLRVADYISGQVLI